MRTVQKVIDINAHIENLKCEINVDNGNAVAKISFTNLGYGDITAIKFNACGYNSFGDIVPVNGKNEFFLIIQDMTIEKNKTATDLKAKLPNADIRKLDLEECQICYADGSIASYEGENSISFELEQFDNQEHLNALHKLYDKNAKFRPRDFEQGWICSCGRFNGNEKNACSLCGKNKANTIKICSQNNLNNLIEEYRISEKKDRESREADRKKLEKEKKKRYFKIGIAAAICIVLAFPIGRAIQLSNRTTYESEEEMRAALQGVWTYYEKDNEYSARYKFNIKNNTLIKRWVIVGSNSDLDLTIRKWNPKQGTFEVSTVGKCIVLRNGNIKDREGNEYERGGGWSDSDSGR